MVRFTGLIVGYHSLLWWANDSCIWSCEIYCARTLLVPARLPHMQDKAPRKPSTEAGHLFFATQHHPLTVFLFFFRGHNNNNNHHHHHHHHHHHLHQYLFPPCRSYTCSFVLLQCFGDEPQPQETVAGVTLTLMASKRPRPPSQPLAMDPMDDYWLKVGRWHGLLVLWIASDEFPIGIFRSSHFRWQCGLMLIVILSKYCWVLLSLKECVCVCLGVLGACFDFCFFHLFAKHRVVFLDLSLGDRCWSNYQVVAGYFADVCPLQAHYFGRIYFTLYIQVLACDWHPPWGRWTYFHCTFLITAWAAAWYCRIHVLSSTSEVQKPAAQPTSTSQQPQEGHHPCEPGHEGCKILH